MLYACYSFLKDFGKEPNDFYELFEFIDFKETEYRLLKLREEK